MSDPIYDNDPGEEKQMEDITFNKTGEDDEAEMREVDIYESSDMYGGARAETQSPVHQNPGSTSVRTSVRALIVCLVLLCVLLLAAVIGTALYCKIKPLTHNKSCTEETKQTWIELDIFCKDGCRYSNNSFYYIPSTTLHSFEKKSWADSRQDCKDRGADLVVVNSSEEQKFIRSFKDEFWIGLNDREKNGTWKWVDGSVEERYNDTRFWAEGQPSWIFEGKDEDCVEFISSLGRWNDIDCAKRNFWICEKVTK